jgi:FkbM family methyltransferase
MKKLYYFDLGLFDGKEIDMFLSDVHDLDLDLKEVEVHGFEAHGIYADRIADRFADNPNVHIHNRAISDKEETVKLYIERTGHGNSIYPTKNNIDINNYVETKAICFAEWIEDNILDFKDSYNILRFNIEGAEFALFNQLEKKDLLKYFNVVLGSHEQDMLKVDELKEHHNEYLELLARNNIKVKPYCFTLDFNVSLTKIITELYE